VNSTGAYDLMEREFVTAPPEQEAEYSLTQLAKRYKRAPSSVARMARKLDWQAKRRAYRSNVATITGDLDASLYAERLHSLHGKAFEAAEITLDQYIKLVRAGVVQPSASDAEKMIKLVREILHRPQSGEEKNGGGQPGLSLSPELARDVLGRLEGLARERLDSGAGDRDLVVVSAPEGERGRLRVR